MVVTGATGYIGRSLCKHLKEQGCRVIALVRRVASGPWDEVLEFDISNISSFPVIPDRTDSLFHLAGYAHALDSSREETESYVRINFHGTENVVRWAENFGIERFVFFSSLAAISVRTPYGSSKFEAERIVRASDIPNKVILRPAMVYGPGCKGNLPRMVQAVSRGWFPPVPEMGRRSMVHVDDVVNAAWLAATLPEAAGKTYVVADGIEYTTRRIHEWICEALGRPAPGWTVPLPVLKALAGAGDAIGKLRGRRFLFDSDVLNKLIGDEWYDSTPIQTDLGFRPTRNLHDSMAEIVDHLRREGVV